MPELGLSPRPTTRPLHGAPGSPRAPRSVSTRAAIPSSSRRSPRSRCSVPCSRVQPSRLFLSQAQGLTCSFCEPIQLVRHDSPLLSNDPANVRIRQTISSSPAYYSPNRTFDTTQPITQEFVNYYYVPAAWRVPPGTTIPFQCKTGGSVATTPSPAPITLARSLRDMSR